MTTIATLSDVCDISMGQAPNGESYNTKSDGYPLIAGAGDFGERTPIPSKYTSSPTKLSCKGDIILCIRATIGDRNWSDSKYCLGRGVAGLRPRKESLDVNYLWHWLEHSEPILKSKGKGATFLQVSKSDIATLQIPLPPLEEQKRIADILDKADALRQKRKQAIAKLDELIQSVFLDMFGDPVTNPKGWAIFKLSEMCSKITDGTHDTPIRQKSGIPFITGKHIRPYEIAYDECDYVTKEDHEEIYRRCNPEFGDVLYTNIGVNLGTASMNTVQYPFSMKNVALLKGDRNKVASIYLEHLLNNKNMKSEILRLASLGGAQQFLSLTDIRKLMIPVPDLNKQTDFSRRVEITKRQKQTMNKSLGVNNVFFNSLQQKAFKGEL